MPLRMSESKRVQWLDRRYTQAESQARWTGILNRRGASRGCSLSIPNLITLARIILVPVVVWAIASGQLRLAFLLFLAAAISDGVDGFLAKRFGMKTELGAYLDPLADKALIVSIYVTLGITGVIPLWIVILVVSRDLMIVGAIILSWLVARPVKVRPHFVRKLNNGGRVLVARMVLAAYGYSVGAEPVFALVMALVVVFSLLSVGLYRAEW